MNNPLIGKSKNYIYIDLLAINLHGNPLNEDSAKYGKYCTVGPVFKFDIGQKIRKNLSVFGIFSSYAPYDGPHCTLNLGVVQSPQDSTRLEKMRRNKCP